jgi:intracellular sulfur oxidation DsrE/DsrF family protein
MMRPPYRLTPEAHRHSHHLALGSIQNHFGGCGPDRVTIVLVIHGQALRAFHSASATPDITRRARFARPGSNSRSAATP